VDSFVKALLVLSRTVDLLFEAHAARQATRNQEPLPRRVSERKKHPGLRELTPTHQRVLRLLERRGAQTCSEVADYMGITRAGSTQLVDTLVREGLVVRTSAERDRREVYVALTDRGRQSFRAVKREQRHRARLALAISKTRRTRSWIRSLEEITNTLVRADRTFRDFCLQCGAHADDRCVLTGGEAICPLWRKQQTPAPPFGSLNDRARFRATVNPRAPAVYAKR
jgi:DNA-binding MarR family transcriptional regulator